MDTLLQDLRYGLRALLRSPGFAVVAILTMALGIGASTAIFGVVDAVLLRPLPFPEPERLVRIRGVGESGGEGNVSVPNFEDWRAMSRSFEEMGIGTQWPVNLTGDSPERVGGAVVSSGFFRTLGVRPALGRTFLPGEDRVGGPRVVVLAHDLWRRRFGGDPGVLGRTLQLDGEGFTVVGVMPADFHPPFQERETALWKPIGFRMTAGSADERSSAYFQVVGRLRPGVTPEQAREEMRAVARRLEERYPQADRGLSARVQPLHEAVAGDLRPALLVLLAAVGCVLLIACANVASLLLARVAARRREMAVRGALGATRVRIARQLLTEALLLSLLAGALGVLLSVWGSQLLVALSPFDLPGLVDVGTDWRVLAFALAASLGTGVLFGMIPAVHASRADLHGAIKEGARGSSGGRHVTARALLVVSEVALALVLLCGAGLLLRSFALLRRVDPGFDPAHVLAVDLVLPQSRYTTSEAQAALYRRVLDNLRAIPGVASAGATTTLPLSGDQLSSGFIVEGRETPAPGASHEAGLDMVSPDYFRTLGIALRRGRAFTDRDGAKAPSVVVVNETLARRYFPGTDPVGERIRLDGSDQPSEIVGVAADVRHRALGTEAPPTVYVPFEQSALPFATLVVRTAADPEAFAGAARRAVLAADPHQPVSRVRSMSQVLAGSVAEQRFNLLLLGAFAAAAMTLAAIGLYGVMAYSVAQRSREIGIRMALGAAPRDAVRLVVGEGIRLALAGGVLGLVAAAAATRLLASLLYRVTPGDPWTFAAVVALLGGTALLASYLPARRATRVDPMVSLRSE
ncbi:MAG: ABC transporter permease [Gemmatimonadetes bacterium]|nr:ABC transporter permease [Gemmatimonadota bacterium]